MRVIIDTNVFISYLLDSGNDKIPSRVMETVYDFRFDLIVSETTLDELAASIERKSYLSSRISNAELREFAEGLRSLATVVPEIPDRLPAVTRDPADDYLIAHALLDRIDYLVTGDKDLLVLERIGDILIVTPAEFMFLLEHDEE